MRLENGGSVVEMFWMRWKEEKKDSKAITVVV